MVTMIAKKPNRAERSDLPVKKCLKKEDPLSIECLKILIKVHRESHCFDFKGQFDIEKNGDWIELTKDVIAMANSGGGYIVFGKNSKGNSTHCDVSELIELDQATLTDKIGAFVDVDVGGIAIASYHEGTDQLAILHVPGAPTPVIFTKVGAYPDPEKNTKQKWVFRSGILFFRHGSKSEPAKQADIDRFFGQYLREMRNYLLEGVKTATRTPATHRLVALSKQMTGVTGKTITAVRFSDEKNSIPVKGLANGSVYSSVEQEVLGIVSGMRTDSEDYASEAQLWRLYRSRKELDATEEAYQYLLVSSLHRHAPPCCWASKLSHGRLTELLGEVVERDSYPSVNATVWVAYCWGSDEARRLLEIIRKDSKYPSAQASSQKALESFIDTDRIRKTWAPRTITCGSTVTEIIDLEKQAAGLEKILDRFLEMKDRQLEIKLLDRLCYGPIISRIRL